MRRSRVELGVEGVAALPEDLCEDTVALEGRVPSNLVIWRKGEGQIEEQYLGECSFNFCVLRLVLTAESHRSQPLTPLKPSKLPSWADVQG
jgi:hypothetical protein